MWGTFYVFDRLTVAYCLIFVILYLYFYYSIFTRACQHRITGSHCSGACDCNGDGQAAGYALRPRDNANNNNTRRKSADVLTLQDPLLHYHHVPFIPLNAVSSLRPSSPEVTMHLLAYASTDQVQS